MKLSCIQMNSTSDMEGNIKAAALFLEEAKAQGADMAALPENFSFMRQDGGKIPGFTEEDHPALKAMPELCKKLGIWLVMGTLAVKDGGKFRNRCYLISAEGEIQARYDKIHLFDADIPGGERHGESALFWHGDKAVVAETPFGKIGLSVCYDLRFPELFLRMAQMGAEIIMAPSAFTGVTGKAHWETLVRARAIENGCFIAAPAECGRHGEKRVTHGHSMIVGPWGEVLAEAGEEPGVITAEVNLAEIAKARHSIPTLKHRRDFA